MTKTTSATAPVPAHPPGPLRTVLGLVAVAACLPYISLKVAWVLGGGIGIPEGSPLRENGGMLIAVNALGVVLDSLVIVLVLALTRPWGQRLPSWLTALPLWAATGLLSPILAAFPVQLLHGAVAGDTGAPARGATQSELLDGWVWNTVYTGFILQALALGTLFVLYGRARWGHLLTGPVTPAGSEQPAVRLSFALFASSVVLLPGLVHGMWAAGADTGLNPERRAAQSTDTGITEGAFALFAVLTVVGLLLAARRRGERPLLAPLVLVWTGSGVLACWGAWLAFNSLTGLGGVAAKEPTAMMLATYSVQMLTGLAIASFGARLLIRRAALPRTSPLPAIQWHSV
ncbi:hypothetical protein [Streptomyces albidus (ex Kaewkla and Franco 2022)]|uniref:hypothetical protein n=1 Tax=Streptomyces albidus (ex Kaewkla and Franco 2022) TaxID=722709 RepID=UPI0015EFC8B9|nr:hypothetical protein [Streptomyces albidus (ex Kaewkla and Franco 2022)]